MNQHESCWRTITSDMGRPGGRT